MNERAVGLIGLGLLGSAVAERLLGAGLPLVGFDIEPTRRQQFAQLGGQPVESLSEIAERATRFVFALPDSRIVARVVSDLIDGLPAGALIIDMTTGDPDDSVARATECGDRGVGYVDATVVGSSEQTRAGQAVILVGGSSAHIDAAHDLLHSCVARVFVAGPSGSGARLKLIVNLVLGLHRAVLAEGLNLARACGFDRARTLEILRATPAASAVMETKGLKMVDEDFSPQARLAQHLKDVQLIRELGRRVDAALPLSETHEQLLELAVRLGLGAQDNSAIIQAWRHWGEAVE